MTFSKWRSLFCFDHQIDIPHLSITLICPYLFVRLMWYTTSKEFKAWPETWDTGIVIGWRRPFAKRFREKFWCWDQSFIPVAVFGGPMDVVYLARVLSDLLMVGEGFPIDRIRFIDNKSESLQIGPTVKVMLDQWPPCPHKHWIADCPTCARKALRLAIQLKTKYEPAPLIDPHEDPLKAFARRQEAANKRLQEQRAARLAAGEKE